MINNFEDCECAKAVFKQWERSGSPFGWKYDKERRDGPTVFIGSCGSLEEFLSHPAYFLHTKRQQKNATLDLCFFCHYCNGMEIIEKDTFMLPYLLPHYSLFYYISSSTQFLFLHHSFIYSIPLITEYLAFFLSKLNCVSKQNNM